jgi:hypothetical protein
VWFHVLIFSVVLIRSCTVGVVSHTVESVTAVFCRCVGRRDARFVRSGFLEAARFLELRQRFCWGSWSVRR